MKKALWIIFYAIAGLFNLYFAVAGVCTKGIAFQPILSSNAFLAMMICLILEVRKVYPKVTLYSKIKDQFDRIFTVGYYLNLAKPERKSLGDFLAMRAYCIREEIKAKIKARKKK